MNERGRDALIAAGLRGDKQVRGNLFESSRAGSGNCAVGILAKALGYTYEDVTSLGRRPGWRETLKAQFGLENRALCTECDNGFSTEYYLLEHLNDTHGLDFIAIARKAPVSAE